MEPKYKVGDFLQFYYDDGTIGILRVDFIEYSAYRPEYEYCKGTKQCCRVLLESNVIGVEPHNEEEYQLYLKLKEKYG